MPLSIKLKHPLKNPLPSRKEIELYDPRKHGVRQSQLSTWQTCREMARLSIVQGWRSRASSVPLTYGTLSHGIIKSVYRGLRDGGIGSLENIYKGIDVLMSESEREWLREQDRPSSKDLEIKEESCAILTRKMPWYFHKWWEQDTSVKWSMIEDKFKVQLTMDDGETVPLIGTFDATFYDTKENLWLFETKNKSRWSDNLSTYLPLDLQVGIYITAMRALYLKSPVGVLYNILRRPNERRKVSESLPEFAERIAGNIQRDPDHYFQRFPVSLTEEEKEEHVRRTEFMIQAFYDWWKETINHPDTRDLLWNSSACDGKYGVCKLLDACANKDYSGYIRRPPTEAEGVEEAD